MGVLVTVAVGVLVGVFDFVGVLVGELEILKVGVLVGDLVTLGVGVFVGVILGV